MFLNVISFDWIEWKKFLFPIIYKLFPDDQSVIEVQFSVK